MPIYDQAIQFISSNIYTQIILIVAAFYLFGRFVIINLDKLLKMFSSKTDTEIDDIFIEALSAPLMWIFLIISILFTIKYLTLPEEVSLIGNKIGISAIIIIATQTIIVVTDIILGEGSKFGIKSKDLNRQIGPLLQRLTRIFFWSISLLVILSTWEINIAGMLAGLGIAGIAISFAVKDSLANIFGGISLMMDKTFKIGDKVELESGERGRIYDIGLRSTRMRTFDNEIIIIPNNTMANIKIKNYAQPSGILRERVNFGVAYGTDPEEVTETVLNVIRKTEDVLEDPEPRVEFIKMGDSSLDFVAKFWVEDYNHAYKTKLKVTKRIYNELNNKGINIPFPTRTVYLKKD